MQEGEGDMFGPRCLTAQIAICVVLRNKLVQITYALADVYDDTPNLDTLVTDGHRATAEEMMSCLEAGDVTTLRRLFEQVKQSEEDELVDKGTAAEIATYLIISAAQVRVCGFDSGLLCIGRVAVCMIIAAWPISGLLEPSVHFPVSQLLYAWWITFPGPHANHGLPHSFWASRDHQSDLTNAVSSRADWAVGDTVHAHLAGWSA